MHNMKNKSIPKILTNSVVGIIAAVTSTVSTYLIRIVLSHCLGEELYGVNSIFISIVSAILILELGMSTAMIIVLYKPINDNNNEKIKSTLKFFRNFYRFFSLALFVIGIFVSTFLLKFFVNTTIDYNLVQLYFLLYMVAVIFKYLWSYKSCLLYANKENSVVSIITIVNVVFFTAAEIVFVIIFKNYWVYLCLFMLQNAFQNILVNLYVNKHYPFVKEKTVVNLSNNDKKSLAKIIKPMFVQRLANQIQDSSSVIILGLIGTSAVIVGYFSNYIMLVHACQTFFNQIGASFTTSYGNYSIKHDNENEKYKYYLTARFYMTWVAVVFSSMYVCLIQPFISMFFGKNYCLSNLTAYLLTLYVFVILNSSINLSTQNAVGAHKLDSTWMIVQAVTGIIMSLVLGNKLEIVGVVLGMLVSVFVFTGILKGYKVTKHLFYQTGGKHIVLFIKELLEFISVTGITYSLVEFIVNPQGILGFILATVFAFVFSNVMFILINFKSSNLGLIKTIIHNTLGSRKRNNG